MNFAIFKNLRNFVNLFVGIGSAVLFFDLTYYAMSSLPGYEEEMCVMGAGLNFWNIMFSVLLSIKFGLLMAATVELHKIRKSQVVASSVGGIGFVLGSLTVFCTACTLPVFTVFGAAISLSFISFYSFQIKFFSLVLMAMGLHMLNKKLNKSCSRCIK